MIFYILPISMNTTLDDNNYQYLLLNYFSLDKQLTLNDNNYYLDLI